MDYTPVYGLTTLRLAVRRQTVNMIAAYTWDRVCAYILTSFLHASISRSSQSQ